MKPSHNQESKTCPHDSRNPEKLTSRGNIKSITMKKIFLLLLLGCSVSIFAASDEGKTISTFYGSKASNSANNPCKGATTRVCGTIETSAYEVSDNSTLITSVLKNAEGVILSKESYYVEAAAQQVLEETAMKYEKAPNTEVRINP